MSAEVGLLTRNIVIEGEDIPQTETESFGARVLVSRMLKDGEVFQGMLRLANVQFRRVGQMGFNSVTDPRSAIAFVSSGDLSGSRKSYVTNCSLHHVYGQGITVYGSDGIDFVGNVIYRTVGEGLNLEGGNLRIIRNLVTTMQYEGLYRQFIIKPIWPALVAVNLGKENNILKDNALVGSERSGLRSIGESCGSANATDWSGNVIHGTLVGAMTLLERYNPQPRQEAGHSGGCTRLRNFLIYHAYDFGIYFQEPTDAVIENVIVSDNGIGIFPMVIGGNILEHVNKNHSVIIKKSLVVGTSGAFPCNLRSSIPSSSFIITSSYRGRGFPSKDGGNIGVVWATFTTATNNAPEKNFANIMAYNTLGGRHDMIGVTFANFKTSCGKRDAAFTTMKSNDDATHPAYFRGTNLIDVDFDSRIYYHRPNVGKINPADCVDMDCDGLKKGLIKDLDGGFIGHPGSVIAHSEFEWGTNPKRGLGDYRIPKVMLSTPTNARLDVNTVYPNKGIIRNSACSMVNSWQAYKCVPTPTAYDYQYLVVESLDKDTEKRRLSPVAIGTDNAPSGQGYIDLVNGPQDHGWCFGYTCQKRVSAFSLIVASNLNYLLYFTSTSPDKLRLYLINNPDKSKAVRIGLYYAKPNRLDVYGDNKYILPKNGEMKDGKLITKKPQTPNQYTPTVSSELGANYLDREWRLLYVVLKGNGVVEVRRQAVVLIGFNIPAMTVDEFFGSNIVQNLATLLGVSQDKIRVVDVVAENSVGRRRKRATSGGVKVTLEIGDPLSNATLSGNSTTSSSSSGSLSASELSNISTTLVNAAQTGSLATALNTSVSGVTVETAASPSTDPVSSSRSGSSLSIEQPTTMKMTMTPTSVKEQNLFNVSVHFLNSAGTVVPTLGTDSQPWYAQISLRPESGVPDSQLIIPNATVPFVNGYAHFNNLMVTRSSSNFIIDVKVTAPAVATNWSVSSGLFTVSQRQLELKRVSAPTTGTVGSPSVVSLLLVDQGMTTAATNLNWRNHTEWRVSASICSSQTVSGSPLKGTTSVSVNEADGTISFSNVSFNLASRYHLCFTLSSVPSGYSAQYSLPVIDIFPSGYTQPTIEKTSALMLRFSNSFDVIRGSESYFITSFYNAMAFKYLEVLISDISVSEGSIITNMNLKGSTAGVANTLASIYATVQDGSLSFTHNGVSYSSDGTMYVDGAEYSGSATTTKTPTIAADNSLSPGIIAVIVICCLLAASALIVLAVYFIHKNKAAHVKGKVIDGKPVIDVHPLEKNDIRVTSPTVEGANMGSVLLEIGSRPPTGFRQPSPVKLIDQELAQATLRRDSPRPTSSTVLTTRHGDSPTDSPTPPT